jgi:hypothetical protein
MIQLGQNKWTGESSVLRDVAARLKVPPSWVAKVEMGERRVDVIEFCWFLSACGQDPTSVWTRIAARTLKK